MKIAKDTVVTLQLKVADTLGRLIEGGKEPMAVLQGHGNLPDKVEQALEGQEPGWSGTLDLKAADAFGARDESLVMTIDKAQFPPGVKVGGTVEGPGPDGQPRLFHVAKFKGPQVILDGNHPLAGKDLRFVMKVMAVRLATEEELSHGHAHGDHGHHH